MQAVTILWRYAGSPANSAATDFADAGTIATWAQSAVRWADTNGILDGMVTNQRFNPKASVKRSEVASMLYHYLTEQK